MVAHWAAQQRRAGLNHQCDIVTGSDISGDTVTQNTGNPMYGGELWWVSSGNKAIHLSDPEPLPPAAHLVLPN